MPFTFAHPAAVLPVRRYVSFPALFAGAVAPDFAYYVPLVGTHSLLGGVMAGVVLLLLVRFLAGPVLALCPVGVRCRVGPVTLSRLWLVGVLVGVVSHLVWDAFTQTDGWAVRHWSWLTVSVVGPHRLYNVIGYVSSVGGLLVLILVFVRWYRRAPQVHSWRALSSRARGLVLVGFLGAAVLGAVLSVSGPVPSAYDWVRALLVGGVQGGGVALVLHSLTYRMMAG